MSTRSPGIGEQGRGGGLRGSWVKASKSPIKGYFQEIDERMYFQDRVVRRVVM